MVRVDKAPRTLWQEGHSDEAAQGEREAEIPKNFCEPKKSLVHALFTDAYPSSSSSSSPSRNFLAETAIKQRRGVGVKIQELTVSTVVVLAPCMRSFLGRIEHGLTTPPTLCLASMPGNGNIFQVRSELFEARA